MADADGDGVCDVKTIVLGSTTRVASATDPDRSTSAGVPTSAGDCDCDGTSSTLGVRATAWRTPMEMVCDVEDDCVGQYDACGICNGLDGLRVRANIPAGDCDDGNQLDVLGVCGGDCRRRWRRHLRRRRRVRRAVRRVRHLQRPGQVYECGCANIPAGDCDCEETT